MCDGLTKLGGTWRDVKTAKPEVHRSSTETSASIFDAKVSVWTLGTEQSYDAPVGT
jgi:hypothetical protein